MARTKKQVGEKGYRTPLGKAEIIAYKIGANKTVTLFETFPAKEDFAVWAQKNAKLADGATVVNGHHVTPTIVTTVKW